MTFIKKITKHCKNCNKEVKTSSNDDNIFCSKECLMEFTSKNETTKKEVKILKINPFNSQNTNNCPICNSPLNESSNVIINNKSLLVCNNCSEGLKFFRNNLTLLKNTIRIFEN